VLAKRAGEESVVFFDPVWMVGTELLHTLLSFHAYVLLCDIFVRGHLAVDEKIGEAAAVGTATSANLDSNNLAFSWARADMFLMDLVHIHWLVLWDRRKIRLNALRIVNTVAHELLVMPRERMTGMLWRI
jgi:hypothetical protein